MDGRGRIGTQAGWLQRLLSVLGHLPRQSSPLLAAQDGQCPPRSMLCPQGLAHFSPVNYMPTVAVVRGCFPLACGGAGALVTSAGLRVAGHFSSRQ